MNVSYSNLFLKYLTYLESKVLEAIAVEKAGLKVDFKEKTELVFPEEFKKELDKKSSLIVNLFNIYIEPLEYLNNDYRLIEQPPLLIINTTTTTN